MTWTKLSDTFTDDPCLIQLPRAVRLLHIEAMIWCNRYNTDGILTELSIRRFSDQPNLPNAIGRLVKIGLWEPLIDPAGWLLVNFLDDQPSAAEVISKRRTAADRQAKYQASKTTVAVFMESSS